MSRWLNQALATVRIEPPVPNVPKSPKWAEKRALDRTKADFGDYDHFGTAPSIFCERAAILEFDGGMPRSWAEAMARLECDPLPKGVTEEQWRRALDDAGRFLDRWCGEADRIGIRPSQILNGHLALVWRLRGRKVVELSVGSVRLGDGSLEGIDHV